VTGNTSIRGQPAIIEAPPPGPSGSAAVYWKPNPSDLLSVVGRGVSQPEVLEVAQSLDFHPPRVVSLPMAPRKTIGKSAAIEAVRRATDGSQSPARAKLTSWSEVTTLLETTTGSNTAVPARVGDAPWTPIWAVLLTHEPSASSRSPLRKLGLVGATSGAVLALIHLDRGRADPAWFAHITNRSEAALHCTNSSGPRPPFGVLTRDEERLEVRRTAASFLGPSETATVEAKLTTYTALEQATSGTLDCIQIDCSLRELVWTKIVVVHARSGTTVPCPLTSPTTTPLVTTYTRVEVPTGATTFCRIQPSWPSRLQSLVGPVVESVRAKRRRHPS